MSKVVLTVEDHELLKTLVSQAVQQTHKAEVPHNVRVAAQQRLSELRWKIVEGEPTTKPKKSGKEEVK